MPSIQLEATLTADQLLQAVKQMGPAELDAFTRDVLALRAEQQSSHVDKTETELLLKINQGLPDEFRQRYEELIGKRQQEALTAEEQKELLAMGEQVEQREAERVEALAALATLKEMSLDELAAKLGLGRNLDE